MTPPASALARLRRSLRSRGGYVLRRAGLLPSGVPDGLGDDDKLLGTRLDARVVVYFAGTVRNLYQLRQWYGPLQALHERVPVLLMCNDSRVGQVLRAESPLPSVTVGRFATLDDVTSRSDVAMFGYVGNEGGNFQALRVTSALHVFLTHGESDKAVSVSGQVKAYDYLFVAGQAARDRFDAHLLRFDSAARTKLVGRAQLDHLVAGPRARADGDRVTVLYAPTWEGAQGSSDYSSVLTHGRRLVEALLADPRLRLVYRPHPRTGANRADFEAADGEIRALLARSGALVDVEPDPVVSFAQADILIADVSAIAHDWLPTHRPLIMTDVESVGSVVARTKLADVVPRLTVAGLAGVAGLVYRHATEDPVRAERAALEEYYFGDPALGTGTERFVAAALEVVAERDAELQSKARR